MTTANASQASHQTTSQTEDDLDVQLKTPVGVVRHGVVGYKSTRGTGYVIENRTGKRFALIRELVEPTAFDRLQVKAQVTFKANAHNAIALVID